MIEWYLGHLDYLASLGALISSTAIARKWRYGWIISMFNAASWVLYGSVVVHSFPIAAANTYFFLNAIYAFFRWRRDEARLQRPV